MQLLQSYVTVQQPLASTTGLNTDVIFGSLRLVVASARIVVLDAVLVAVRIVIALRRAVTTPRYARKGVHELDPQITKRIDDLYGEVREGVYLLPLAALVGKRIDDLHPQIGEAIDDLDGQVREALDELDSAVEGDAVVGADRLDGRSAAKDVDSRGNRGKRQMAGRRFIAAILHLSGFLGPPSLWRAFSKWRHLRLGRIAVTKRGDNVCSETL